MEGRNLTLAVSQLQFKYTTVYRNFFRTVLTPRNIIPAGTSLSWRGVILP